MKWITPGEATIDGSFDCKFVGFIDGETLIYYAKSFKAFDNALMFEKFDSYTITESEGGRCST